MTFRAPINPDDAARDSFGQPTITQEEKFSLWGSVEAITGREYWWAQQAQVMVSHRITIRYGKQALTVKKNWQVSFDGKILNVFVPPRDVDGTERRMEILCLETL